ncbi:MAG: universal stress protein [Bacteroidota bacterium]
MKQMLIPTDFSACASHAAELGFAMAELFEAKVHLFTQIELPSNWESLSPEEQKKNPEALQRIHNAEVLMKEWVEKAQQWNIPIVKRIAGGPLTKAIEAYAEKESIDFIVMGSHGASGKNEFFIGSNTQKVVRTLHLPVLVVKEPQEDFQIKKVVFASNFGEQDKPAFRYFLEFVKSFQPEIHLVAINTSGFFSQPYVLVKSSMADYEAMAKPLVCKSHFYRDFSVDAGIRNLSEEIGAQLIGISNQNRQPLKRMLVGSNVEALVNHADIPVLSIDF